ncbi:hypothetical protein SO802_029845 [Lithocarpus litseifolius]|uniref:Transposase MuDR plant domain-containing protein n=1 Tax=Lithocarpus litseifolius TaxID=425828 RepID=A0AAW2BW57_9ROSI
MIGRDDFHENTINYENVDNVRYDVMDDHDDEVMDDQDNIGDGIGVQHNTTIVPTYEAHGPSFLANTWDNIVDPSNVEIPFSSSWVRGMNFSKGLIFPNKEAVKQAIIVYSMDNNKNYIIEWSNQQRLCVKCANESCAWKVRAFLQRKLNGLWAITVYGGRHTYLSFGVNKDGRMMDSNFLAKELHTYVLADHTSKIKDLQYLMKERFKHNTTRYGMRNKRLLQTYTGIGKSHTKSCRSYCWHIRIAIRVHKCLFGQSTGTYRVLLYSSMCSGLSLLPLLNSHIVGH